MKSCFKHYALPLALLLIALSASAQNDYEHQFSKPFSQVMAELSKQFGVKFKYDVDTTGIIVKYADARIRPYSIAETLKNICAPFEFVAWDQGKNTFRIKPFEYPRRKPEDGAKFTAYLSSLYNNTAEWENRRELLRKEVRERLGIDPVLAKCYEAKPLLGKIRKYDGYTIQNFRLPIMEGRTICGSIYTPAKSSAKNKSALIICPAGHFAAGRYNPDLQKRYATLARMGSIAVSYDIYAWGQSEEEVGAEAHRTPEAHIMQTIHGLKILDFMIQRKDVDRSRIGCNGGSGGGSQTVLLTLLDNRYTASCPTVSMCSWFDGGCPCESGMPIHRSGNQTCNMELAACFAPRPMMIVSNGGDWTSTVPEVEFPYLQKVYGFYGAKDKVFNVHLPNERHDFGPNKRQAVYDFFCNVFSLDRSKLDEEKVTVETEEQMKSPLAPKGETF
ncbi:MAG: hypothetical protein MJZ32_07995 [Bacteroidaceae bacterium]|nr:hypothetical protein [Bacteroidaceae bacterium]